jgi:membrane protease YdiL (CAAX protease family)
MPLLRHLVVFVLYFLSLSLAFSASLVLALPPVVNLLGVLAVFGLVMRLYLLRHYHPQPGTDRNPLWANSLRGRRLRWVLAAAPAMLLLSWALGEVYVRLVPVPARVLDPFGELTADPGNLLLIAVVAIVVAPVVEEFFFRGLIQHELEEKWGIAPAVVATSLLFALVHVDTLPWVIPLHFVLGSVFGWVVWATRSVWAGVVLHAVNNAAAVIGLGLGAPEAQPTVWETGMDRGGWLALAGLAVAVVAGAWVARGLHRHAAGAVPHPSGTA